jgi:hypothetical protein
MTDASIYVSLISLLVALTTLYWTQFRPPRIGLIVGSTIGVNHQEDGFSICLPVTMSNVAHRPGLVNRCSLVFLPAAGAQTAHYIEWTEFRKRDQDKSKYVLEEFAGPLQIEGRSSVSKLVWFRWRNGVFPFSEGKYAIELIVWLENGEKPAIREKHDFFIGPEEAKALAEYKANSKTIIKWMGIDKQIEANKLLTQHELEKLLG